MLLYSSRQLHTSAVRQWVCKQTKMRVVDNSKIGKEAMTEGKPVKCIHVYKKSKVMDGQLGDKILVTIKGQMKRGYVVGLVAEQRPMIPKFDTNNVVLVENNGNPSGNRCLVPVPNYLRSKGPELAKIIAICGRFV